MRYDKTIDQLSPKDPTPSISHQLFPNFPLFLLAFIILPFVLRITRVDTGLLCLETRTITLGLTLH